jgi:hypothetical protein
MIVVSLRVISFNDEIKRLCTKKHIESMKLFFLLLVALPLLAIAELKHIVNEAGRHDDSALLDESEHVSSYTSH